MDDYVKCDIQLLCFFYISVYVCVCGTSSLSFFPALLSETNICLFVCSFFVVVGLLYLLLNCL
jgi:hypothetical protein